MMRQIDQILIVEFSKQLSKWEHPIFKKKKINWDKANIICFGKRKKWGYKIKKK
jgi:hypothetical protein